MITKELLDYIKQQLEKNVSQDVIRQSLAAAGWAEKDINEGINLASNQPQNTFVENKTNEQTDKTVNNLNTDPNNINSNNIKKENPEVKQFNGASNVKKTDTKKSKSGLKKVFKWIIVLIVIAIIAGGGYFLINKFEIKPIESSKNFFSSIIGSDNDSDFDEGAFNDAYYSQDPDDNRRVNVVYQKLLNLEPYEQESLELLNGYLIELEVLNEISAPTEEILVLEELIEDELRKIFGLTPYTLGVSTESDVLFVDDEDEISTNDIDIDIPIEDIIDNTPALSPSPTPSAPPTPAEPVSIQQNQGSIAIPQN